MPYLRVSRLHPAWAAATLLLLDCAGLRLEALHAPPQPIHGSTPAAREKARFAIIPPQTREPVDLPPPRPPTESAQADFVPLLLWFQPPASPKLGEPAEKVPPDLLRIENEVHTAVNGARRKFGLAELQMDPALQRVARDYSRRMATQGFFSHTAPNGETASDRFRATGLRYSVAAENLFQNFNVPRKRLAASAVNGWLNSPGHRASLLRPEFTHTGIGVWRTGKTYYFTQLFIRPG